MPGSLTIDELIEKLPTGFTSGPWRVDIDIDTVWAPEWTDDQGDQICLKPTREFSAARWEANAALIALAPEMATALSTLQERRDTLFEAIQHGDQDHKDWLRDAIAAHFAGEPVPVPRGSGNKEAMIATLQEQKRKLEEALIDAEVAIDDCHNWRSHNHYETLAKVRALLSGGGE